MSSPLDIIERIQRQVHSIIVGQQSMVEGLLIGLLNDGHILLEGPPGLAKTLTISTLSKTIQLPFQRVQFTPDLLPADLIGTEIYNPKTGDFKTRKGPIFSNIILADEINRAPPKVQSALLEAMQERQVTIGERTWQLPQPFLVLATQNPIEQEGTYALPEAQADRFLLNVRVGYPSKQEERQVVLQSRKPAPVLSPVASAQDIQQCKKHLLSLRLEEVLLGYIIDIVRATRRTQKRSPWNRYISSGASVRASLALEQAARTKAFLSGRHYVTPDDVKAVAASVLRHRIILTYEAEADKIRTDDIVEMILRNIPIP